MSETAYNVGATPASPLQKNLPNGWRRVKLGDIATYWNGRAFKPDEWREEGTPIIRIENLNSAQATFNYFQGEVRPQNCINNGDLLVSWSASLDAYIWDRGAAVLNQHIFKVVEDSSIVLRDFFYYMLRHTMTSIRGHVHGATMQHITKPEFENIEVPLPPLAEQRRIAEALCEQMAAVEKARAAAQVRLEASKALPAAFLRQVFPQPGQPLPAGWRVLPLGDAGEVVSGVTIGRALNREGVREVPYLRVANVKDGHLDLSDMTTTPATPSEIEALKLRHGDLLLTEGGDPDKLGRGTLWEEQLPECIHQNHIFRVRLNRNLVEPTYASVLIGSPYGKGYFLKHAKQTTGIATINQRVLKAFPILLPPLPEQRRIAEILREQVATAEKARAAAEEELKTINALPAALLRRAFNGEL
jgi:type I restriction enzyme, S subunit